MMVNKGFTLIELLIVVIILAVLAGIVIPQFRANLSDVKMASVETNVEVICKAIEIYFTDHGGTYPGYPDGDTSANPTEGALINQLLLRTDRTGRVDPAGPCGPYLRAQAGFFPNNPFNKKSAVAVFRRGGEIPTIDGDFGWYYIGSTGEFNAVTPESAEPPEDPPGAVPPGRGRRSEGSGSRRDR